MARPTTLAFSKFVLMLGDGASPETFAAPCGLTSRGVNETTTFQETVIPDCDDEDAPAWVDRDADSQSATFSGSGNLAKENFGIYREWKRSGQPKRCRIYYFEGEDGDELPESAVGYDEGLFVCSTVNATGERGRRVQLEIELLSTGELTWHDAA